MFDSFEIFFPKPATFKRMHFYQGASLENVHTFLAYFGYSLPLVHRCPLLVDPLPTLSKWTHFDDQSHSVKIIYKLLARSLSMWAHFNDQNHSINNTNRRSFILEKNNELNKEMFLVIFSLSIIIFDIFKYYTRVHHFHFYQMVILKCRKCYQIFPGAPFRFCLSVCSIILSSLEQPCKNSNHENEQVVTI